jgi:rhamnose transport system ATP-binding protein
MPELLEMTDIKKSFGGIQALRGVTFDLAVGEVHALVGENGAGKSTLIKILSGAHLPDEGEIRMDGQAVRIRNPKDAQQLGIATIYQETSLYPDLSVLENIFMGRQLKTRLGTLDWQGMRQKAQALLEEMGIDLPLTARLGDLGKARAQLVEIVKALSQQARVLIMDEPSAALTPGDVERLFQVIKKLQASGVAIIYISHRLEEIFGVADRVTVLRDGQSVGSSAVAGVSQDWLITHMVGRSLSRLYPRTLRAPGKPLLEVSGLTRFGVFSNISFSVREGEIVGLAGLVGSGRSEVVRAIFGVDSYDKGKVLFNDKPLPREPAETVKAGLALLPEDRAHQGLILPLSIQRNLALAMLPKLQSFGFVQENREEALGQKFIKVLQIRPSQPDLPAGNLSGGNQQKIVLGKWLATEPTVLILDEPTQGVDVGTKAEVHRLVDGLVQQGLGILLISSDMPEVLGMADRILVMHQGRISAELARGASAEEVMRAAAGLEVEVSHVR